MAVGWKALKAVLIDLSGTLHIENDVIPGSIEALKRLRNAGLSLRFVTNTTKESRSLLLSRLTALGFDIKAEEVFTSLLAARSLVESLNVRPLLFLEDEALEDFQGINTTNPNSVVIGLAPTMFQYNHLNHAFRLLQDGAQLIAIHKSKYYRRSDGLALGPGPFVECLEYASGQKARVVGKPAPDFFATALADVGAKAEEAVMIGDDVQLDVGGALEAGLHGLLVKTESAFADPGNNDHPGNDDTENADDPGNDANPGNDAYPKYATSGVTPGHPIINKKQGARPHLLKPYLSLSHDTSPMPPLEYPCLFKGG